MTEAKAESLDDIMLAMDVVDTLRHEREMTESELNADLRREDLIDRLRGIYDAQGITVPDDVLMDGVMALEEERFAFTPPKRGLMTTLARLYIRRRKWLPLLYTVGFIIGSVLAVNYVGFVRPAQVEAKQNHILITKTLPERLSSAHSRAHAAAASPALKTRADDMLADGKLAVSLRDVSGARGKAAQLEAYAANLTQSYSLRIISRFNETSGVYLESETNSSIRNFYLIVEAVTDEGDVLTLPIEDEVYKTRKSVGKFGVRVPKTVFDTVAADKKDDQIIQNDIVGTKSRGVIDPVLNFEGANDWPLGFIVDW